MIVRVSPVTEMSTSQNMPTALGCQDCLAEMEATIYMCLQGEHFVILSKCGEDRKAIHQIIDYKEYRQKWLKII